MSLLVTDVTRLGFVRLGSFLATTTGQVFVSEEVVVHCGPG